MSLLSASGQGKRNLYCIYKLWLCICKSQNPHQPHAETDSFMKNGGLIGSLRGASATPDHHQKSTLLRCWDQEMRRGGRLNKGPIFPEWKGHFSSMGLQILNALIRHKIIRWTTRLSKTQSRHPFTLLIYISYMNSHHPSPWFQNALCLITSQ